VYHNFHKNLVFSLEWRVTVSCFKFLGLILQQFSLLIHKISQNTVKKCCEILQNKIQILQNTKLDFGAKFCKILYREISYPPY
jgi:hypothetical protein